MLPFSLSRAADGTWRGRWAEEKLFIVVGGTDDGADAGLVRTLTDVVERWAEVRQTVATWAAGLPAGEHVALEPATLGGFAAGTCGFDEELSFDSVSVLDPALPDRVEITFYTGYPDGYATFRVVLVGGLPIVVTAYAS